MTETEKALVAGAYAAAAKRVADTAQKLNGIAPPAYMQVLSCLVDEIRALTPADARQASQTEDEFVPDTSHQQRVTIPANHVAAIASADARARLAEFDLITRDRPVDPVYWDKHHRNRLLEAIEAAARTPDSIKEPKKT